MSSGFFWAPATGRSTCGFSAIPAGRHASRQWLLRCLFVLLAGLTIRCLAAGADGAPAEAPAKVDDTNSLDALRGILQLQEQIHATQMAIEHAREEADTAAARNAELFTARLQAIEQSLDTQRAQELETMQRSNRDMLILAGTVAFVGFLAMLVTSIFQSRAIHRLAQISAALPEPRLFGAAASLAAPAALDARLVTAGAAEQANLRLLGALDRLEQRLLQLEHAAHPALNGSVPTADGADAPAPLPGRLADAPAAEAPAAQQDEAARLGVLLGKGQSLLNLDQPEAALNCFDEILAANPNHTEALVRKGTALERLRKLDEAIECYDRAIAADGSLTIAYLYKGGLFNRQERFNEALACYEQALRTQEKRAD